MNTAPDPFRPRDEPRDPPPSGVIDQLTGKEIPRLLTASETNARSDLRVKIIADIQQHRQVAAREYMHRAQHLLDAYYALSGADHLLAINGISPSLPSLFHSTLSIPFPPLAQDEGFRPELALGREYVGGATPDHLTQLPAIRASANKLEQHLRRTYAGAWPFP